MSANPVILDCEATKVEGSDASLSVQRTPVLAELSLSPIPVEVNMQKLAGVVFARLTAVEQTLKTRLDGFEKRLEALEARCKCQVEN